MHISTKNRMAALALAAALIGPAAIAQSVTQGAIVGTVEDASGAVIPGATVVIRNNGTNSSVNLTADGRGFFNAPLLQPGEYTVTVNSGTFAPFVLGHVIVQVGQPTEVRPLLGATADTTVTVSETLPTLNFESPDFNDVIDNYAITNIPENNRRWSSLAMLTPGVVSDASGFGLISVRGISPLLNNVLIDGADDNVAFWSEERGRTREAYSTSEDAVREFSVNTGVYTAEYGRSAGAVVNSVTKSGTNDFHGEAYAYDRESNWSAYTPLVTQTTQNSAGTFVTSPLKPKDLRKIFGFAAGGALVKDKLFWYYTFDEHRRIFPGTGAPSNPATFFTTPDAALPAGQVCNTATGLITNTGTTAIKVQDSYGCVLGAREKLGSYAAGATAYTAGLSSLLPDLGSVPRVGDQEINTPKLDWQINSKNRLSLLYHRLRWDSPGGVQTQAVVAYATDTFGNDFVKLDYGLSKLETQVTSRISNELGYQYSRELEYETQQPFNSYTTSNLVGSTGNVPYVNLATSSGYNLGSPYYSYRTAYPDERKWQVFDTLYHVKGNHSFKYGVDILHNYDLVNNTYESNGDFSYTYIGNYFADQYAHSRGLTASVCNSSAVGTATTTQTAVGTSPCYTTYYQGYGNPLFDVATLDYGFFAQDNWKVTPRLTVELGVRYDYEQLPTLNASLRAASGTFVPYNGISNQPSDKNNVGPRVGFAFDVFGDGKTVLRGGYGLFYGRMLNGTLESVDLTTGSPLGQYTTTYKPTTAGAPLLPNLSASGTAPAPSSYFFAKNFQNPQVHEFDLILQQDLGHKTAMNISYLGSLGREMPNFLDVNLNPAAMATATINFTGGGPVPAGTQIKLPTYQGYGNTALLGTAAASYQTITEVVSNVNSSYNALVGEVKSQALRNLELDVNATFSHALDYGVNQTTGTTTSSWYDPFGNARANYGNSNFNIPFRFTGYALYTVPGVRSSSWLRFIANGWSINDDFQMQSGLPYSLSTSSYATYNAQQAGINGGGGVSFIPESVLSLPGLGRNTYKLKRDIVDDIRLVKAIPFTERYKLELRGDFFNIANHENISTVGTTGYILSDSSATPLVGTATYQPTTFGVPTMINASGFLYTPREIQLSARFSF